MQESYQTSFNAEVRAAAIFALGCCLNSSVVPSDGNEVTEHTRELFRLEQDVLMLIHQAVRDGSMLVRVECSIAIGRAAVVPPSSTGSSEERELCHHDQFLKAFQNQRARVLLDMNHQRMSMMMMAPVLHHSETGAATPDTGSRRGLRGTHSDGHVSHERWISGDMNLRTGVARSETDMLSTRKHLCGAGIVPSGDCKKYMHCIPAVPCDNLVFFLEVQTLRLAVHMYRRMHMMLRSTFRANVISFVDLQTLRFLRRKLVETWNQTELSLL